MKKKSILLLCPIFYNYHLLIKNELLKQGYDVEFYTERHYGILYTIIKNFFPFFEDSFQRIHLNRVLNKIENKKFDILLVIRGYNLPASFINSFSQQNPFAKKIMYQWDSNANNPYFHLIPNFDKVISFDFMDCEKNLQLKYLPLFYLENFDDQTNTKILYDYLFIGVFNPFRYEIAKNLLKFTQNTGATAKIKLYIHPTTYLKYFFKLVNSENCILTLKQKSPLEISKLVDQSRNIIDLSHSNQSGMSLRIIEALSKNKTIITSNSFISKMSNYNEHIHYFNFDNFDELKLIRTSKNDVNKETIYSLGQWLQKIIND